MRSRRAKPSERRGALLLVVLVVVALMSIANLSYYDWTFVERKAANAASRQEQALAAAESAAEMLKVYLAEDPTTLDQDGGWYDNPTRFRAILLGDSDVAELRSRAAVLAPVWGSAGLAGGRFGLEDDSGRLNLNTLLVTETRDPGAGRDQLLALPGMTEAIADAILDWMDEDDTPRTQGAEVEYYSTLDPPYTPPNAPFSTIEQLLLVRDVTPELLWGLDADRNHEASVTETERIALPVDNSMGELTGGWASLLTLHSAETNFQPDGSPKININSDDLEQLHEDILGVLDEATANFVIAYRQGGPEESEEDANGDASSGGGSGGGGAAGGAGGAGAGAAGGDSEIDFNIPTKDAGQISIDFDAPAAVAVQDVLDLVAVTVRVVESGELTPTLVPSPWQEGDGSLTDGLTTLLETLTTTDAESIPGRINVNQAPRSVLTGVPDMPPEAVEAILANRTPDAGTTRPNRLQATWLLSEGYLDLEQMRAIAPYVTAQGAVFRAQCVGGYEAGGPVRRLEVVLDATTTPVRIVMRRDLRALGAGFDPAVTLSPEQAPPQ